MTGEIQAQEDGAVRAFLPTTQSRPAGRHQTETTDAVQHAGPLSSAAQLRVVILAPRLPYPNGMAASNRVQLLARALAEQTARVEVWSMMHTERPPTIENERAKGSYRGVAFEYLCGSSTRPETFSQRRMAAVRAWLVTVLRVLEFRRSTSVGCVYLWFTIQRWTWTRLFMLQLLRGLSVPVVIELNERPWSLRARRGLLERVVSPLYGAKGVIAISSLLGTWAGDEASRRGLRTEVLEVPILVDLAEQTPDRSSPDDTLNVLFAASPGYREATTFILDAMQTVWAKHPDCRLVITGTRPGDADWLSNDLRDPRVRLSGRVPRRELLELYSHATALLVPLFDDTKSRARFPTKIGEYLASGRPIVTTEVGEIPRYFQDGISAFMCSPDEPAAFGGKICEVLADAGRANEVGAAGRRVAESNFDYRLHAEELHAFMSRIGRVGRDGLEVTT